MVCIDIPVAASLVFFLLPLIFSFLRVIRAKLSCCNGAKRWFNYAHGQASSIKYKNVSNNERDGMHV